MKKRENKKRKNIILFNRYTEKEEKEIIYHIWFSMFKLKHEDRVRMLLKYGSVKNIYRLANLVDIKIAKDIFGNIDMDKIENIEFAKKIYEGCKVRNIKVITIKDKRYPQKLLNIYDPPYILYVKGDVRLLSERYTAIIGARDCSSYGANIAKEISNRIINLDKGIISGLAIGIDTVGHIQALKREGKTIAVIGSGIDNRVFYPSLNKEIFNKIMEKNLVISEYPYYKKPGKYTFPARNRIIAAMSDELFVIEAKLKSGTLITAEFAYEIGKDIYVPLAKIDDVNFYGSNRLIRDGAIPITHFDDIDRFIA